MTAWRIILLAALLGRAATSNGSPDEFERGCTLRFQLKELAPDTDLARRCGKEGDATRETDKLQNQVKNNFCAAGDPLTVNFNTLLKLQAKADKNHVGHPTDRSVLADMITENGSSIGEGTVVRLMAFLHNAHFTKSKETSTCHAGKQELKDIHIDLVPKRGADLCRSVTAEMIPHFRPQEWIGLTEVEELENPVRVTGQLFYDASHAPCHNGTRASPARASVWEVHPVYAIDVCLNKSLQACPANDDTKWKPLHKWLEEQTEEEP
jgi:hypothetical protein